MEPCDVELRAWPFVTKVCDVELCDVDICHVELCGLELGDVETCVP